MTITKRAAPVKRLTQLGVRVAAALGIAVIVLWTASSSAGAREHPVRATSRIACHAVAKPNISALDTQTAGFVDIGHSIERRPIRAMRMGTGPNVVLWIGGIHGDERNGAMLTESLVRTPPAALDSGGLTLIVVEDLNPDGTANGTRANARGVDLNRNFPATSFDADSEEYGRSPLSQPESCVAAVLLDHFNPALTITIHSHSEKRGVDSDGPADAYALQFAAQSPHPSKFQVIDIPARSTPGSLGQWWGADLGHPILTLEWSKSSDDPDRVANDFRAPTDELLASVAAAPHSTTTPTPTAAPTASGGGQPSGEVTGGAGTSGASGGSGATGTTVATNSVGPATTSLPAATPVPPTANGTDGEDGLPIGRILIAAMAFLLAVGAGFAGTYVARRST